MHEAALVDNCEFVAQVGCANSEKGLDKGRLARPARTWQNERHTVECHDTRVKVRGFCRTPGDLELDLRAK